MYFFWKGSAKAIIQQYQQAFGKPDLPPIWALGWHSASYAYSTLDMVKANVQSYEEAGIPLEGVWLDIPYMADFADFTVNETAFAGLKEWTEGIQESGKRMIVIVDAGIAADDASDYYNDAQD
jgi:alpha-glucosidase